jgi:hypothetical protein
MKFQIWICLVISWCKWCNENSFLFSKYYVDQRQNLAECEYSKCYDKRKLILLVLRENRLMKLKKMINMNEDYSSEMNKATG